MSSIAHEYRFACSEGQTSKTIQDNCFTLAMRHIYLDYNATTPIAPSVQEAMQPFLTLHHGNPSSGHSLGRACHEAVATAREQVALLLGCDDNEIVFTSCGTESNNLAIKGIMMAEPPARGGHFVTTAIEHPAVLEPARFLQSWGYGVTIVGCDGRGVVDLSEIADAITADTRLVSIMHANNETGVIQPIREIANICRQREVLLHVDAAQSVGKIRTAVEEMGADLLTIAGHKIYGPKGIGALYVRRGTPITPIQHGAGHEGGLRAGTENVPYIVALGKAATLAGKAVDENSTRIETLRDRLRMLLEHGVGPSLSVNSDGTQRLPNTLNVNFPNVDGNQLLAHIPELCASTGAACHSGETKVSSTLAAMGVSDDVARGAVRLSLGWYTSEEEIDRAANLLIGAWEATVA